MTCAAASAQEFAAQLPPRTPVAAAPELIDHVPYVPPPAETPAAWRSLFDGYDPDLAAREQRTAEALLARFTGAPDPERQQRDTHEVLITHAYQVAWLVRDALDAPPIRWLGLNSANTGLTTIDYRPGLPPTLVMFNDLSHLPADLRWTGFPGLVRP